MNEEQRRRPEGGEDAERPEQTERSEAPESPAELERRAGEPPESERTAPEPPQPAAAHEAAQREPELQAPPPRPDADDSAETPGAPAASPAPPPRPRRRRRNALTERPESAIEVPRRKLAAQSRRDFLLFAAGIFASSAAAWWLLPDLTKARLLPGPWRDRLDTLAARVGLSRRNRERALDRALTFDDDVAETLYSRNRRVRTYERSQVTPLRNNYNGRTPGAEYLPGWTLRLSGLASGRLEELTLGQLRARFPRREQVTRLICVEGWSAIAWWGGLRFGDLLAAYPPMPGARWAALRSAVNLDFYGRPDPYYVSIDLDTARHPQTLLATEFGGRPLTLAHGAPLRLLAPMKLGLKNIKAITEIEYTIDAPPDYWNERGYSKYDGL